MALAVIHGLLPNQKLKSILEGCANLNHLWASSQDSRNLFARAFFLPQCVYIRFKYSRSRKFLQLTNDKLVQAELTLRFWKEHNNLHVWAPIPLFVDRADYRCLELALIQEWQPRLNYPFICQLFHPRKGLLKKPAMNTNTQFGDSLAPGQTQVHSAGGQRYLGIGTVPKPSRTLDHYPRFWVEHQS